MIQFSFDFIALGIFFIGFLWVYLFQRSSDKQFIELYNRTKLRIENNGVIFVDGDVETIVPWNKIKDIKINENSKRVKEIILITNQGDLLDFHEYENKESIKKELSKYMDIYYKK